MNNDIDEYSTDEVTISRETAIASMTAIRTKYNEVEEKREHYEQSKWAQESTIESVIRQQDKLELAYKELAQVLRCKNIPKLYPEMTYSTDEETQFLRNETK